MAKHQRGSHKSAKTPAMNPHSFRIHKRQGFQVVHPLQLILHFDRSQLAESSQYKFLYPVAAASSIHRKNPIAPLRQIIIPEIATLWKNIVDYLYVRTIEEQHNVRIF